MPDEPSLSADAISRTSLRAGGRTVPLLAGVGALSQLPLVLQETSFSGRLWVVADTLAMQLHGGALRQVLPDVPVLEIPGDEASKNLLTVQRVWDWLLEHRAERRDALVAFGGGVVCDLVGFAAACYLRGIAIVNVPTTLLAQVDASVGGKTGVDHARGKNLIGAFHQPLAVVADTTLLGTLSPRAFAGGMAEVAKIAMALDGDFFQQLEADAERYQPTEAELLTPVVRRAIELKAWIVERDERESGDRMLLNYGHTVGHALEAASTYTALLHGEAISVGMEAAVHIARGMGLLAEKDAARQTRLLQRLGLPTRFAGVEPGDVLDRLESDKKRAGAVQRWILARRVGKAEIRDDAPEQLVREAVQAVLR